MGDALKHKQHEMVGERGVDRIALCRFRAGLGYLPSALTVRVVLAPHERQV